MAFLLHRVSNRALRATLGLFADYAVEGRENLPDDGPLIVVANHQSNMDPPILATALRRDTRFLAKEEIFRGVTPIGRWFLQTYGARPLRRGQIDLAALRWAIGVLDAPRATLALFPEGTRNPGSMGRAHAGIATLALRSEARIVPVGLEGVEVMHSWMRVFVPRGTIRVHVGRPFRLNVRGGMTRELADAVTTEIMGRVAALLPPGYRGHYSDAAGRPFEHTEDAGPGTDGRIETSAATPRAEHR